jgi:hypothetical protein
MATTTQELVHKPDRRRYSRHDILRPCKVFDPVSMRFAPGHTKNISQSGAVVLIQWGRHLSIGDAIDLVIGWSPKPLLPADAMVRCRIARTIAATGEVQVVAVEFDHPGGACARGVTVSSRSRTY